MPVYQYQGVHYDLPDGLTSEQAIAKIKGHLGQAEEPQQKSFQSISDLGQQQIEPATNALTGIGEAGLGLVSGGVAGVAGPLMGIQARTRGASPQEAEQIAGQTMERMTYQPQTEVGKNLTANIGEFMNQVGIPLAGIAHTLPPVTIRPRLPVGKVRDIPVPEAPKRATSGVDTAIAELNAPETPVAPPRAIPEGGEGAFGRIAGELGYKEGEFSPINRPTPMEATAAELSKAGEQQRATTAQNFIDARKVDLEQEVARKRAVEAQADFIARSEKAPAISEAHRAWAEEQVRLQEQRDAAIKAQEEIKAAEVKTEEMKLQEEAAKKAQEEAQAALDKRQQEVELAVKKQATLDFNAAERARQEAGTIPPEVGPPTKQQMKPFTSKKGGVGKKQGGAVLVPWGSKTGLNGPVGQALKDIGHAMIKTPEEAIALASKAKDVSQNFVQKGVNLFTKGGGYLKAKVNNPVVHFAVDRFLKAKGLADADISAKLHGEYLSSLRSLTNAEYEAAFKLVNAADLNQKTITPDFMQKHGLSPKLQEFITTHQRLMDDAVSQINAAREAVGKKPITAREAYSAMSMTGDYRKVAYKTIDGEKRVVGVISANSKFGKLGLSLDKLEKQMLAKDPTLEFGPLQDRTHVGKLQGTPHEAFQDVLETIGENNPNVQEFLNTLKEVAKDNPSNFMGMQKHTLQKKGVWGMEGRKPWLSESENAKAFFENQAQYLEGVLRWSKLAEAAKDVNSVLRDENVAKTQKNAIRLSEDYMSNALGMNPSRVGKGITEVFNAITGSDFADSLGIGPSRAREAMKLTKMGINMNFLSLNPSFLGIQLLQGPVAMPAMTALLRGRGLAPARTILTGGFDSMGKAGVTLLKEITGNTAGLSTIDKQAMQYAKDHHIYATDMVEHSNQTRKGTGYYTVKVSQAPAAMIEKQTRAQVYLALVDMMHESGLKPADGLFEQAHSMTNKVMNDYSAMEKPPIYNALGPVGSMAYNLKSFGHNEISRWALYAREIGNTGNPVPLLTQMASTIAIAGVFGLPFYKEWESLYDTITAKLYGKPRSLTLDVMDASATLGKEIPKLGEYTLSHGAPTMLGMDISGRTGMGDFLPTKMSDLLFVGGSAAADIMGSAYGAATKQDEAHVKDFVTKIAPPALRSALKNKWYTKGDLAYTQNPDKPPVATARLNATDKLLKPLGISGINESVQKERYYQGTQLEKAYQDIKDRGLTRMAQDVFNNKPISKEAIDTYIRGQGDLSSLEQELSHMAQQQGMTQQQIKILRDAASSSIGKIQDLQRRVR